jgi:hypothetical protein
MCVASGCVVLLVAIAVFCVAVLAEEVFVRSLCVQAVFIMACDVTTRAIQKDARSGWNRIAVPVAGCAFAGIRRRFCCNVILSRYRAAVFSKPRFSKQIEFRMSLMLEPF